MSSYKPYSYDYNKYYDSETDEDDVVFRHWFDINARADEAYDSARDAGYFDDIEEK